MANYTSGSRYRKASYGTFRGEEVVYPKIIDFNSIGAIGTYTVTSRSEYRSDLISVDVYGRPDLGWIVMAYNQIDHPKDLVAGTTLKIPSAQGILNAL